MMLRHVGIKRPQHLVKFTKRLKVVPNYRYEVFPDGSYKLWSDRVLGSGCNHLTSGNTTFRGLIYCENCDEFFSTNQFEEVAK